MKNIFIICFLISFCSCSVIQRRIYSPAQVNSPSLQQKKDYNLSLLVSTPSGFDFNGGYALTNRLAVIGGLYTYKNRDTEEDFSVFSTNIDSSLLLYKHKGFHAGAGAFIPLVQEKNSFFMSFFGIFTKGNFEMREKLFSNTIPSSSPKLNFYKGKINRWSLQGSLHFYNKIIHQTLTTRLNYVGYNNVVTDYTLSEQTSFNLPPIAYPEWTTFLDFSFDTKIFFTKKQTLGLQLFGTVTGLLNRKDYNFYYYPMRLGVGFVLKPPYFNKK